MGYQHIENLYKVPDIFLFREVWALEKVHGTSAHVSWKGSEVRRDGQGVPRGNVHLFSGGESAESMSRAVPVAPLVERFEALGHLDATVYGELYGGRCMKMRATYGDEIRFVAFEVQVGDRWLAVDQAADVCAKLGIEFVPFEKVPATIEALDAARAAPSEIAKRRGILEPREREGIVVRPLVEFARNNGSRVIAKYKNDAFKETQSTRQIVSPEKLAVLTEAEAIADEWVTDMRLEHVLAKIPTAPDGPLGMEDAGEVIRAMIADVRREGEGEIAWSKEAEKAIGSATARLFKKRLNDKMREASP